MANIIDALVVTLGLDGSGFFRGVKQTQDASDKLRENIVSDNKRQTDATKAFQDSIRSVKTEALGLLLVLGGASSLKGFVGNIISGDAATGRLANNLGIATDKLSAWEQAVTRVGGSKGDIDATLSSLSGIFQNYQLRGDLSKNGDLAGLGLSIGDLNDPTQALLKLADASKRFSPREFNNRASALGIDQNTINLLEKGRGAVEGYLREAEKAGAVSDQDAKAAQELQDAFAKLKAEIEGGARPAITSLANGLVHFLQGADKLHAVEPAIVGTLTAIAAATLAATWEWVALAAAVSAVYALYRASPAERRQIIDDIRTGKWRQSFTGGMAGSSNDNDNRGGHITGRPGSWIANQQASVDRYTAHNGAIEKGLAARGFDREQISGIAAGINAESGGNPSIVNSRSGAYGIGQWLGPRKAELFRRYGSRPTLDQQLDFLAWELRGGDRGGSAVMHARGAGAVGNAYITQFMRPGGGFETSRDLASVRSYLGGRRGGAAASSAQTTTITGGIVINTAATDARGIAKELPQALRERGIVYQTQTGLQQ